MTDLEKLQYECEHSVGFSRCQVSEGQYYIIEYTCKNCGITFSEYELSKEKTNGTV